MSQFAFVPTDDDMQALMLAAQSLGTKKTDIVRDLIPHPDEMSGMLEFIRLTKNVGTTELVNNDEGVLEATNNVNGLGDLIRTAVAEYLANIITEQTNVGLQMQVECVRKNRSHKIIIFCGKYFKAMAGRPGYDKSVVIIGGKNHVIVKGPEDPDNYFKIMENKMTEFAQRLGF